MKGRTLIPLVLGLVIGVFAIKMFVNVLKKAQGAGAGGAVSVVHAKVDIGPTVEITESMVEVVPVSGNLAPKQAFSDLTEVIGRVTTQTIPQGVAVVPALLAPKGTPPGLAARIRDGYRAVAVKVDEEVGVAGWIKPGSRVDVVAVMVTQSGGRSETVSRVVLQNVEVLAVGQDIGTSGDTTASLAKSVTLLVLPNEVPKLHLAATKGSLRLAMRNQSDEVSERLASTTGDEVLGGRSASSKPASSFLEGLLAKVPKDGKASDMAMAMAAKPTWTVEVLAGSQAYQVKFDGEQKDARRVDQAVGRLSLPEYRPPAGPGGASVSPVRPPAGPVIPPVLPTAGTNVVSDSD